MPDRNIKIIGMAKSGMTYTSIGPQFGLSKQRIGQICQTVVGPRCVPAPKVSDDERKKIIDMGRRELCVRQIALEIGRSDKIVRQILISAGVDIVNALDIFGDDRRRRAVAMFKRGYSYSEVADKLGMTRNAVAGACHRAGVRTGWPRKDKVARRTYMDAAE